MSQKIENILNLALEATPEERERSGELETGYDPGTREWELMTWVDYVIRKALDMRMPVAVNISFGNTYGPHEPITKGRIKKTLIVHVLLAIPK